MGGRDGPYSVAYSYDTLGRIQRTLRRVFNQEHIIETTYNEYGDNYNEYGDKSSEITSRKQIGEEQNVAGAGPGPYAEVRYSYLYDEHSNWTQEIESYRSQPDGPFLSSTPRLRSLTYY